MRDTAYVNGQEVMSYDTLGFVRCHVPRSALLTREPWEMSNSKKLNSCRKSKYT